MATDNNIPMDDISRAEVDTLMFRAETRNREDRAEVLGTLREIHNSIKDLKREMNGQFRAQGAIIAAHDTAIKVLEDRGTRDVGARWGAVVGGVLAVIAGYFGLKG